MLVDLKFKVHKNESTESHIKLQSNAWIAVNNSWSAFNNIVQRSRYRQKNRNSPHEHLKTIKHFTWMGCDLLSISVSGVWVSLFLVTYLNQTPLFEWCEAMCGSRNGHQKDVFKRECSISTNVVSCSRFNKEHNWGDLYDHVLRYITFTHI